MARRFENRSWSQFRSKLRHLFQKYSAAQPAGSQSHVPDDNPWILLHMRQASPAEPPGRGGEHSLAPAGADLYTGPRWLGDDASPTGFADDDGTLKQVDRANWRLTFRSRPRASTPASRRWQVPKGISAARPTQPGSTWLLQAVAAAALLATGIYATRGDTGLAANLNRLYAGALATDYSGATLPAIENFLATHHIPLPAIHLGDVSGSIQLHVPLAGTIVRDYATAHPDIVVAGTSGETVLAAGSGTVVNLDKSSAGYVLAIDHGRIGTTWYVGLADVSVSKGEYVASGQPIGHLPAGKQPQLRFSIVQGGRYINPHDYIHFPGSGV